MAESIAVVQRTNETTGFTYFEWMGTDGPDVITGFPDENNDIYGLDGADDLRAGAGGFRGYLVGGEGDDTLRGGSAFDQLRGGPGGDLMMGGGDDDWYYVDSVDDVVFERLRWEPGRSGDSVLSDIDFSLAGLAVENLFLQGSASEGIGNKFANQLYGNNGDNILDGGRGVDTLIGGDGNDVYILRHARDFAEEPGSWTRQKTLEAAQHGHDTVLAYNSFRLMAGVEDIFLQETFGKTGLLISGLTAIGNHLDNRVTGNSTANNLNGRFGNDTLTGGDGADAFIFSETLGAPNADLITDFRPGEDRIVISGARVEVDSGPPDADAFHHGAEATTAEHRMLFDGTTLRYDADGTGAAAALDIAYFEDAPVLTAEDIFIT